MTHIEEWQDVIHRLHGATATHRESVPVKETWQGKTIWEGIVEVFDLHGHPKTDKVYAWMHDTGEPGEPPKHVTVLHLKPALNPLFAVRSFIMQEIQNASPAQA